MFLIAKEQQTKDISTKARTKPGPDADNSILLWADPRIVHKPEKHIIPGTFLLPFTTEIFQGKLNVQPIRKS